MRTRGGANVADFRKTAEFRSLKAQHQALVLTPKCTGATTAAYCLRKSAFLPERYECHPDELVVGGRILMRVGYGERYKVRGRFLGDFGIRIQIFTYSLVNQHQSEPRYGICSPEIVSVHLSNIHIGHNVGTTQASRRLVGRALQRYLLPAGRCICPQGL